MKKYKIYVKGNYLVVVDTQKNEYFYGIRKEVHVDKSNVNTPSYRIFNVKDFSSNIILSVPNILKENGTAYSEAEFDTFYQENTGNFNGGGSAPTQGVINITRTEAVTLQASSSFMSGATYTITDADVNLYGGTEITLTAITSNELSLQGSGKFYCPKYDVSAEGTGYGIWTKQMEGTFSNLVGTFTPNEVVTANNGATATYLAEGFLEIINGDWSFATSISGATATADVSGFVTPSYTEGQIVHWGGKSWTNVNGNIGASIDKYTLNAEWTEIPFNSTDYNVYIDEIHYDFGNDMIIYRKDRYNNVVSGNNQVFVEFESPSGYGYGNPIKDFQWGCAQDDFNTDDYFYIGIQSNEVIDSYFETLNTRAKNIWFNNLSQISYIQNNTLSSGSYIQNNTLSGSSYIQNNTLSINSYIEYNTLSGNSYIQNNTLNNSSRINSNTLSGSSINYNTLSNNSYIQNNTLSNNSYIQNNTLSINSYIEYNTLSGNSYIQNNTLNNSSRINSNTLSGSSINYNTLSNSYIQYNTLSNNSYIQYNTLSNGGSIQYNTLSSGSIRNNTLSNNSYIQYNTLSSGSIRNNTLNNGSRIQNTTLSGSQLTFSNEIIGKTASNLEIKNSNVSIPNTATIIFNPSLSKTIFKRLDGTPRLQYVNNINIIVITNVDA